MEQLSKILSEGSVTIALGDIITALSAFIALIAWCIRLEFKNDANEKSLNQHMADVALDVEVSREEDNRKEDAVWARFQHMQDTINDGFATVQKTVQDVSLAIGRLEGKIEIISTKKGHS